LAETDRRQTTVLGKVSNLLFYDRPRPIISRYLIPPLKQLQGNGR